MQKIRCATVNDTNSVATIAQNIPELMTTMPRTPEAVHKRFQHCQDSLQAYNPLKQPKTYFFVLEEDEQIAGTSAIYANIGSDRPFYSYKIVKRSQLSPELEFRTDYKVLQPSNDFTGAAEVGTLYLTPQWRGGGRGTLLSAARFLFIAAHRYRFNDRVFAEIRGWVDEHNQSPFWNAVGQKFYGLSLQEADLRSGNDHRFIADLMPPYPIYIDLLPPEAQRVVGIANDGSKPAAAMLQKQGFRNHNYVNIFDGGLCLNKYTDDVTAVRDTTNKPVTIKKIDSENATHCILSNTKLADFAATQAPAQLTPETTIISPETAAVLELSENEPILTYRWNTDA